jgi:hypothetical protein
MPLTIEYHQDGSVTVKSGDERVTVVPHPTPAVSPAVAPAPSSVPPDPPIVVGPPATGPRVMIRLPALGDPLFQPSQASPLKEFVVGGHAYLMLHDGEYIDVGITHRQPFDLSAIAKSAQSACADKSAKIRIWFATDGAGRKP